MAELESGASVAASSGPSGRQRLWDGIAIVGIAAIAVGFTLGVLYWRAIASRGILSLDIYEAHYPNLIYALASLERGHGLLWNRDQNCGQPFLPSTLLGLLYPIHAVFLFVGIDAALLVVAAVHLLIGGVGMYALCRELSIGRTGAVCGAIAFQLGGATWSLATWLPTSILGIYVWIPWAALLCERVLKEPTFARGAWLGVVFTLQLLPGYPQILLFTYQFIAFRVVYEFLTTSLRRPVRLVLVLAFALALPALLGAAQLLPMVEFAEQSVRSRSLTDAEINPEPGWHSWHGFRQDVAARLESGHGTVFAVVPMAWAALSLLSGARRRLALFYILAGGIFFALAFDTPVWRLYLQLPFGRSFREPHRFIWMTGFALSVAVAFGADVLSRPLAADGAKSRWPSLAALLPMTVGAGVFWLLSSSGLRWWEWLLVVAVLLLAVMRVTMPRAQRAVPVALVAVLLVNLWNKSEPPWRVQLKDGSPLYRHAAQLDAVRARLTLQDRVYHFGQVHDVSLMAKSASVFDFPAVTDYEPQTSRRYAEYFMKMLRPADRVPLTNVNEFYYLEANALPSSRPLLGLLGVRFLVVDPSVEAKFQFGPLRSLRPVAMPGDLRVYENDAALPRAFYVPRLEVMNDPLALLDQLAKPRHNPRLTALVDEPPADGFVGSEPGAGGDATILEDRSEVVRIRVRSTRPGFLFLADQYYPGWEARVNDMPTPIMRANYAFRLVRVPAGEAMVDFRYRPQSVRWGMIVSGLSLAALAGAAVASARRARPRLLQRS
jgi:hypothetical protein